MNYNGLIGMFDDRNPHLGGGHDVGDPFTYCPSVWDYVISRFGVGSVLDLGSGCGNAALYFHRKGLQVVAVDGLVESAEKSLYPAVAIDITKMAVRTCVDLVHCQEVVEHIEERHLDNLLTSLLSGKFILMTHAVPGQGGHHHVNEQPPEYWVAQMERRGCRLLEEDSERIRRLAQLDGAAFMARTGMIFANSARC